MKHLKSLSLGPPGGWICLEPRSGYVAKGVTFMDVVGRMAQHWANMGYPPDPQWRVDEIVEDRICEALSPEDQLAYCVNGVRNRTAVGWREILRFLEVAVKWLAGGAQTVEQAEAERRAAICAQCPLNVGMGGCAPCKITVNAFRATFWTKTTSQDAGLQSCGVCGCDNKVTVHLPLENLQAGKAHLTFPDFCWQKPTAS